MSNNRLHLLCALVASTMALAAEPARAQLTAVDRNELIKQGFTAADFKSFEVTAIAPTNRPFRVWRDCVRSVGIPTVQQKPLGEAQQIAFSLCAEKEEDAQAAVAARTGLRQAARVMRMARAVEAGYLGRLFTEAHSSAPTGAEHIGGWTVFTGSAGRCGAFITTQDLFAPGGVIIERIVGQATPKVTFLLRGDVAGEALKSPVTRSDAVSLSVFSDNLGRSVGSLRESGRTSTRPAG